MSTFPTIDGIVAVNMKNNRLVFRGTSYNAEAALYVSEHYQPVSIQVSEYWMHLFYQFLALTLTSLGIDRPYKSESGSATDLCSCKFHFSHANSQQLLRQTWKFISIVPSKCFSLIPSVV